MMALTLIWPQKPHSTYFDYPLLPHSFRQRLFFSFLTTFRSLSFSILSCSICLILLAT